mgnify:CR=1 FL=1|jgi:hypothetical protein
MNDDDIVMSMSIDEETRFWEQVLNDEAALKGKPRDKKDVSHLAYQDFCTECSEHVDICQCWLHNQNKYTVRTFKDYLQMIMLVFIAISPFILIYYLVK